MKFDLADKVVIVTGASSGIGKSLCIALAMKKSKVVLASRNIEKLKRVEQQCSQYSETLVVPTDVSDETQIRQLIQTTLKHFHRLDIYISNAGISMKSLIMDCQITVQKKLMEVNYFGAMYGIKYALPHLVESKGMVVGVSSITGFKGLPGRSGYAASKFALNGFLETLKIETLNSDFHVMAVCPGFTATDIRKNALLADGSLQLVSPRDEAAMMQPEEVANQIIQGIEKKKDFLVLTRQGKLLHLLNKFFPQLVSRLVYREMSRETDSPIAGSIK